MEYSLSEVVATVVVPLVMLWLIYTYLWKKSDRRGYVNLPPGPKKLPIIGNMHLISQPSFRSYRELAKEHGPLMHLKIGAVDAIVVSSAELAKEVLKDKDPNFADRPESIALQVCWYDYLGFLFCPYGDYWKQMRKICQLEVLSPKNVRACAPIRRDEISGLVQFLLSTAGTPVNLTEKLFAMISSMTCRSSFGKVCKDKSLMIKTVQDILDVGAGFTVADAFPSSALAAALGWGIKLRLRRWRRKLDAVLDDVIHRHEDGTAGTHGEFGNDDLVDVLLRIKETGQYKFPIGYDNIKAVLLDIFAGGTDTTSSTMVWAMTELMRNPRVLAKAQAEVRQVVNNSDITTIIEEEVVQNLPYLKLVVMEALRLHPQGSILPRASRETCEVGGYTIPGNMKVLINVWAIQRDPKYWQDPEEFKPERFQDQTCFDYTGNNDFRYLPFGSGKRICPGTATGLISVTLSLAQLLYSFNWKLPDGVDAQTLDMIESTSLTTPRRQDLIVVATPYQPPTP